MHDVLRPLRRPDTSALRMDVSAKREQLQLLHDTSTSIIYLWKFESRCGAVGECHAVKPVKIQVRHEKCEYQVVLFSQFNLYI